MRVPIRWLGVLALVTASFALLWSGEPAVENLSPGEATARLAAGDAVLVDVREPAEWAQTGVVATAHTLALSDLRGKRAEWGPFLEKNRDQLLILYCRTGNRSGQAATLLAAEGFQVANAGGLRDWTAAGQPTRPADAPRKPSPDPSQESDTPGR